MIHDSRNRSISQSEHWTVISEHQQEVCIRYGYVKDTRLYLFRHHSGHAVAVSLRKLYCGLEPLTHSRYSIVMQLHRIMASLFTLFLFHQTLFANADKQSSISAERKKTFPISGFAAFSINAMAAESHEYVYQHGEVLSKLRWPLNPAVSYSIHGGLYFPKGIFFDSSLSFIQPMQTDTMTDKDFEEIKSIPPRNGITKFSEHNCTILKGIREIAKLGLQLPLPRTAALRKTDISVSIGPMISLYYASISWHSYGGYLQYARIRKDGTYEPWSKHLPKIPVTGAAVSYQQQLIIPAIGIGVEAAFPHKLRLFSDIHVSADVIALSEDIHHARNLRFVDIMGGGFSLHGTARLSWQCLPYFALFTAVFYEYSTTTEGITLSYDGITAKKPSGYSPPDAAGTALGGGTFSIGFAFVLGR